jgi:predicted dehydrogenase
VELVGVVDPRPVQAERLPVLHTLAEGLRQFEPDIVCVTVNEQQHEAVFDELAGYRPCAILSEKPLTTDLSSATRVVAKLRRHDFSMNLVERFSPVVTHFRAWAARQPDLNVVRAEAHWGKHRIFDPRPTMGVLSELIHPLDLVQYLFLPLRGDAVHAQAVVSDLDVAGGPCADSVDVTFDGGGVPILLHASFAWPERVRSVTALARSGDALYRILFTFDQPHWDCDRLEIFDIASNGRWRSVLRVATDVADLPKQIAGVGKVETYVRRSLGLVPGGPGGPDLVGLDEALELQRLLQLIGEAAGPSTVRARYRRPEAS